MTEETEDTLEEKIDDLVSISESGYILGVQNTIGLMQEMVNELYKDISIYNKTISQATQTVHNIQLYKVDNTLKFYKNKTTGSYGYNVVPKKKMGFEE